MDFDYATLAQEVHIHAFQVSQFETAQLNMIRALLDIEEQERLHRFTTPMCQLEFLVAHGMLHALLGDYLMLDPISLQFTRAEFGKPVLTSPSGTDIAFNLAHTHDYVLLAITRGRQIGIDIEYLDPKLPTPPLLESLFTERERQDLASLPPDLSQRGFYTAWTRKEAFIKATGEGFSADLLAFSVTVDPRLPAQLTFTAGEDSPWNLHHTDIAPEYVAALVVAGPLDYCVRVSAP